MKKDKTILVVSVIFFIFYGLASTFGAIFLASWGASNLYKRVMIFMGTFPIDWFKLSVEKSFIFTLLNVLFWTITLYFFLKISKIIVTSLLRILKSES